MTQQTYDSHRRSIDIDHVHNEIHLGHVFTATYDSGSINDTETAELLIQTGSRTSHLVFSADVTGSMLIELFEAPTNSSAGDPVTNYNKNRSSAKTSTVTVTSSPTLSDDGTMIDANIAGSGKKIGGATDLNRGSEWNLSPNTDYLFRATNISGGSARVVLGLDWYEPQITNP